MNKQNSEDPRALGSDNKYIESSAPRVNATMDQESKLR